MNDDLNLILTILTKNDDMSKIVVNIPHGLNDSNWSDWEYYGEEKVFQKYKDILPVYCAAYMKKILHIEEVFAIIKN